MANQILSNGHPLYSHILRALSSDPDGPRLMDAAPGGTAHLEFQTNPRIYTQQVSALVSPEQGIASDDTYWYEINAASIKKYPKSGGAAVVVNTSPFAGLPSGSNHLAGGFIEGSTLFVISMQYDNNAGTNPNQIGTKGRIAKYDIETLLLTAQIDITNVPNPAANINYGGVCRGHTGNYMVISFHRTSDGDPRLRNIHEFDESGTLIVVNQLDADARGTQGIAYNPETGLYLLPCWEVSSVFSHLVVDQNFHVVRRLDPTGMSSANEQESATYDGNNFYLTHEYNQGIRRFTLAGLYLGPYNAASAFPADHQQFIDAATLPDTGTIIIRGTPRSLFDFNTLWDNLSTVNDWTSWISGSGVFAGRVNGSFSAATSGLIAANTQGIFGFHWAKSGSNVTYSVSFNGSKRTTQSNRAWVTKPDLYLGGANAGHTGASDFSYQDVLVFDYDLPDADLATLFNNFDYLYTAPALGTGQPLTKRLTGIPGMARNRGVW